MAEIRTYTLKRTITEKDAGRKIKYYLRGTLKISYRQYCAMKSAGGLKVNGAIVHADYILQSGDLVTAALPDDGAAKQVQPEMGEIRIAYQDEDLLILDKAAPLACQCTPKQPLGTLENRIIHHFGEGFTFRPLNRLDKGTSGLMAAAMHPHACQLLQKQLHTPDFMREYLAVVEGCMEGEGTIDLPIAKDASATVRRIIDPENGQRAVTHYRVEESGKQRSLVRLRLETGRTHQIRVHLSAMGYPIVGDFLYGAESDELPGRFALHSTRIRLTQPLTEECIEIESPLPDELRRLLR